MCLSTADCMCNASILKLEFPGTDIVLEITSDSSRNYERCCVSLPEYVIETENVRIVDDSRDLSGNVPMEFYAGGDPDLIPIMLLEETGYEILLKGHVDDAFPYLRDNSGGIALHRMRLNGSEDYSVFTLNFGGYVGKGWFDIVIGETRSSIPFEVRSKKISYLTEYPIMLSDISEFSSSLLLTVNSPLYREYGMERNDNDSLYGMFVLLDYIFSKRHVLEMYALVKANRRCELSQRSVVIPAGMSGFLDPSDIPSLVSADNLIPMENGPVSGLFAPAEVVEHTHEEDYDTPENRMVKDLVFSLQRMVAFLNNRMNCNISAYVRNRLSYMNSELDIVCSDPWLREVGDLTRIPFESTILQRDEGYSSLFGIYQILGMGAALRQDDEIGLLQAQNTPIYQIYEYWCYTRLYRSLFRLSSNKPEMKYEKDSEDRWIVTIRRNADVKFFIPVHSETVTAFLYYNQSFERTNGRFSSYSVRLRPDFTLIISKGERIRIINFDAKYKAKPKTSDEIITDDSKIDSDCWEYDIYKMHTYRDALMRSVGSYILYPGTAKKIYPKPSCREDWSRLNDLVIPSVGAIPLIPGSETDRELDDVLKTIIEEVAGEISGEIDMDDYAIY